MENTLVSCCEKIGSLTWCLMVLKCISPNLVTSSYLDSGGKGERGSTYFTGQLVVGLATGHGFLVLFRNCHLGYLQPQK